MLPSEEVTSEQIEDVLAMLTEMGINVVETEEAEETTRRTRGGRRGAESEGGELVEVAQQVAAKAETKEPTDRTDDPVRMYLREMGSVELLSREGEIAIAKRIEAGRETMIAGLCESPLTFQAIIIWRDELNEGKILLRDIIDLEATYAGPDAKNAPAPVDRRRPAGAQRRRRAAGRLAAGADAGAARCARRRDAVRADDDEVARERAPASRRGRGDEDDIENALSLAAMEAELKPKVRRDLRQRRRHLQEAAPPAGPGRRVQAQEHDALAARRSAATRSSRTRSSPR